MEQRDDVIIEHPNREKASSKAAKATVILLLLVSAALMVVVTIGGWKTLQSAKAVQIVYILIYLLIAFYVGRWNRGVLPVSAALAILLAIFAAVAVPGWFDRDADGYVEPALNASIIGTLTAILIPVQVLLIGFAMRAFNQSWNVEVERTVPPRHGAPQTA